METNDLKIFQRIAQLGSISEAAEQLGYTQSNVTARLKVLEAELHTPLFHRTNKGVQLLENGEILLGYADTILALLDEAKHKITKQLKKMRIGATPVMTQTYLTKLWMNNGCDFSIYTRNLTELVQMLENSTLDGILGNQEIKSNVFLNLCTFQESVVWVQPKEVCVTIPWNKPILVSRNKGCPYRKIALDYVKANDLAQVDILEVDSLETMVMMIEKNIGYGVLPTALLSLYEKLEIMTAHPLLEKVAIYFYVLQQHENQLKSFVETFQLTIL